MEIYSNDQNKPDLNTKLNKPAIITYYYNILWEKYEDENNINH